MYLLLSLIVVILVVIVKEVHDVAEEARTSAERRQESLVATLIRHLQPIDTLNSTVTELREEIILLRKLAVLNTDPKVLKKLLNSIKADGASSDDLEVGLELKLLEGMSEEDWIEWRNSRS